MKHHLHAEDAEQVQQPIGADFLGVTLQGGERLLGDAQQSGGFALGQACLLSEGFQQRWKLLGGMDDIRVHRHKPQYVFFEYRLYAVRNKYTIGFVLVVCLTVCEAAGEEKIHLNRIVHLCGRG